MNCATRLACALSVIGCFVGGPVMAVASSPDVSADWRVGESPATSHAEWSWSELAPNWWFRRDDAPLVRLVQDPANEPAVEDAGPDIADPGPDLGAFPRSAATLRQNRAQLEMGPFSYRTANSTSPAAYAWPYLFRYGLTDAAEFRLSGAGLMSRFGDNGTTGFGVLVFGTKIHLWDARMDRFLPAAAFEAFLQTNLGSAAFRQGNQPSLNLNLDFPFNERTSLGTSLGYSGTLNTINVILPGTQTASPAGVNSYIFSCAWALKREITADLDLFVDGYYTRPIGIRGDSVIYVGTGFFYQLSDRLMTFGSANAGLTDISAPFLTQLGLAIAF